MKKVLGFNDWIAKYYPTLADSKEARKDPIGHSLRKWRGLRDKVLERYHVEIHGQDITQSEDFGYLTIGSTSCALCVKFYDYSEDTRFSICKKCPLFKTLGRPCDYGEDSPYMTWRYTYDPEPMIKALEKARRKYGVKKE